jgi:hypothetical protein
VCVPQPVCLQKPVCLPQRLVHSASFHAAPQASVGVNIPVQNVSALGRSASFALGPRAHGSSFLNNHSASFYDRSAC